MAQAMRTHRLEGFIVMTKDRRWGWGQTVREAVSEARSQGGNVTPGERLVYKLPHGALDAYVDSMGSICWDWSLDAKDRGASGEYIETPRK